MTVLKKWTYDLCLKLLLLQCPVVMWWTFRHLEACSHLRLQVLTIPPSPPIFLPFWLPCTCLAGQQADPQPWGKPRTLQPTSARPSKCPIAFSPRSLHWLFTFCAQLQAENTLPSLLSPFHCLCHVFFAQLAPTDFATSILLPLLPPSAPFATSFSDSAAPPYTYFLDMLLKLDCMAFWRQHSFSHIYRNCSLKKFGPERRQQREQKEVAMAAILERSGTRGTSGSCPLGDVIWRIPGWDSFLLWHLPTGTSFSKN